MKVIAFLFIILSAPAMVSAQSFKNRLYINAGADYHLNAGDVTGQNNVQDVLRAPNMVGGRLGIEYLKRGKTGIFLSTGTDYRMAPQRLDINYNAGNMGFAGSSATYTERVSFTNHFIVPYCYFGYAVPAGKTSTIDISFGAECAVAINGQGTTVKNVGLNITDQYYTDLVITRQTSWGNKFLPDTERLGIPVTPMFNMQVAYRPVIGRLRLKLALTTSGSFNKKTNYTVVNYFGPGRSDIGKAVFIDKFQSVSLIVGVGL